MAEPFKNQINRELIKRIAGHFEVHAKMGEWDQQRFLEIATAGLDQLELKERSMQIVSAMEATFPDDFENAATIIEASLAPELETVDFKNDNQMENGIQGWAIFAIQEYVGRNGLAHIDRSLALLKEMTKRLTSEFGIRYFLDAFPYETLKTMQGWVMDPSEHVRRLVSEGTRTRLPWGMQLKRFIADPSPVIPLLECLKDDPSEYVRRSVANNLNDLSKDHSEIVIKIASNWWVGADENRRKLIRHGLRTLVKKGNPLALAVLGYGLPQIEIRSFVVSPEKVHIGEEVTLDFEIVSTSEEPQQLLIDYAVHFVRANGRRSAKVFKWTTITLEGLGSMRKQKRHSFVPVTVRKYYPGMHQFELLINGESGEAAECVLGTC